MAGIGWGRVFVPSRRHVAAGALLLGVLVGVPACSPPPPPAAAPTADATCSWHEPPRDPAVATSACGVVGTEVTAAVPRPADLLPTTVEFFVDRVLTCAPAGSCVVGDNRDHLAAPGAEPPTDPSRRRGSLTLDWGDDRATLDLAPRCRLAPDHRTQRCRSVPVGAVHLALTSSSGSRAPWRFHLELAVPGDAGGAPTPPWSEDWALALDPTTGRLLVDGEGSGAPDAAVVHGRTMLCAAPGVAPPAPPAPTGRRRLTCEEHVPADP